MIVFTHKNPSTGKIIHVGISKNETKALKTNKKGETWKHIAKYVGIRQDVLLETTDKEEAINLVNTIVTLEKSRRPNDLITTQI